jgi:NADH-quinone oxidoreductase subunit N
MVYLGLEVMSLSLYALVALRRDHGVSTEAAMKYFVLGALASASCCTACP